MTELRTVLITGASSGIGLACARYFHQQGWRVLASMRKPEACTNLHENERLKKLCIDVGDERSIEEGVAEGIAHFGKIDVLVNNAGYALVGAFESFQSEQIRQQMDTNVLGLMRCCTHILPHFHQNKGGSIVNIASVGGRVTFPLYSVYHATKWAVEGFSESLNFELNPHNIFVKLVEPGPIVTDFYTRSMDYNLEATPQHLKPYVKKVMAKMNAVARKGGTAEEVARVIFKAATKGKGKMRYPIGGGAGFLLFLRKCLPGSWFIGMIKKGI